jgi:hypothetical protein
MAVTEGGQKAKDRVPLVVTGNHHGGSFEGSVGPPGWCCVHPATVVPALEENVRNRP